MYFCINLLHY